MKEAMLEYSRHPASVSNYSPVTRLTNLDDLEVELKSNGRPNWLPWFHTTQCHHATLWRKVGRNNYNLDILTMRGMQQLGIDYMGNSKKSGGGCFRRAATRVFHNLSTHLKTFLNQFKTELAKVTTVSLPTLPSRSYFRSMAYQPTFLLFIHRILPIRVAPLLLNFPRTAPIYFRLPLRFRCHAPNYWSVRPLSISLNLSTGPILVLSTLPQLWNRQLRLQQVRLQWMPTLL
jgi:hypothetical protein